MGDPARAILGEHYPPKAAAELRRSLGLNESMLQQYVLFVKHLAALVLVGGFTFGGSWLLYRLTDFITPLRVDEQHEQPNTERSIDER